MKNKLKYFSLIIFVFFISLRSNCQLRTIITPVTGVKIDVHDYADPGNHLVQSNLFNGMFGGLITQEVKPSLFIETGLYKCYYDEGYSFKRWEYSLSTGLTCLAIPLRLKHEIDFFHKKLSLTPFVGLCGSINTGYLKSFYNNGNVLPRGYSSGKTITISHGVAIDSMVDSSLEYEDFRAFFPLVEAGINLNIGLYKHLMLNLSAVSQTGFSTITRQDIIYRHNNDPVVNASSISKGDNFQILISMSYPVSDIWQNFEKWKEKKPERQEKLQKNTKKRFYAGYRSALIWKTHEVRGDYSHITPYGQKRPLLLSTEHSPGIFGGWMLSNKVIFEAGFEGHHYHNTYQIEATPYPFSHNTYWREARIDIYNLLIKYRISTPLPQLFVSPYLGAFLYHSKILGTYGQHSDSTDIGIISYEIKRLQKNVAVLGFGATVDYFITPGIIFTIDGKLNFGFTDFNELKIGVQGSSGNYSADILYDGTQSSLSAGIKIPFDFRRD